MTRSSIPASSYRGVSEINLKYVNHEAYFAETGEDMREIDDRITGFIDLVKDEVTE